jgi:hypothetical protein
MADNPARIRQYERNDERLVRFVLGKTYLEPLTVANRRGTFGTFTTAATLKFSTAYVHPIFLSVWVALSSIMAQYMNWWPSYGYGALRWLAPLPAFASMAVPLMFLIDWCVPSVSLALYTPDI